MPVPLREQFRLLERAARETGDPFFGARLGQNVSIRKLSAFGKWVSDAKNLAEAIERSMRGLNSMLQTSTVLTLARHGPVVRWSIEFLDPECDGRYHNELLGLSYMIDVVRCHAGCSWAPNVVLTTSPRGTPKGALEQIFHANVSAGQAVPAIEFDSNLLAGESRRPSEPFRVDGRYEEPALPAEQDELATVVAVTELALCEGYPRIDWVASKLGMTRRTLQRRISDNDTTFAGIVEELLRKTAQDLLAGTNESITGVALKLGYADSAHFTRAFTRWTGASPSAYRRARSEAAS